ncbi:hypothetical protein EG328_010268 [Venturia inaequalis]|uniref:F-box domain-containing protein n=1 Tax=Venturia inaequalis TaxID=5025 RepID=A0A8H3UTP7_VENIN|nr:hypothetical protein EG328_010268 [Venturia inaequalis]KAE9975123.1 hypothetical protein EG327_008537 [Venturia inaequalis]
MSASTPTLLGIPQELRDKIFRNILKHDSNLVPIAQDRAQATRQISQPCSHQGCSDKNTCGHYEIIREMQRLPKYEELVDPSILFVSTNIRHQAQKILFGENVFLIDTYKATTEFNRFDLTASLSDLKLARRLRFNISLPSDRLPEIMDFLASHPGIRNLEFVVNLPAWSPSGCYQDLQRLLSELSGLKDIKVSCKVRLAVLLDGEPGIPRDLWSEYNWPDVDGHNSYWYIVGIEKLFAQLEAMEKEMLV